MIEFLATILIFFICWVIESIKRCRNKFGMTSELPEIRTHEEYDSDTHKPLTVVEVKGKGSVEVTIRPC